MSEQVEKKVTYDIDELFKSAADVQKSSHLRCLIWGPSGVGKTFTSMTFPEPVYMVDTDGGITSNLKYYPNKNIRIFECYETITEAPKTAKGENMTDPFDVDPIVSLEKFDLVTKALTQNDKVKDGTVVIDTITDVWSWIGTWLNHKTAKQVSKGGSEYMNRFAWGDANNRYEWIMKRLKQIPANVVLLARSKAIYDSQGNITTDNKADAQKKTEYHMDFFIEMKKNYIASGPNQGKFTRSAVITKSRGLELSDPLIKDFSYDKLKTLMGQSH